MVNFSTVRALASISAALSAVVRAQNVYSPDLNPDFAVTVDRRAAIEQLIGEPIDHGLVRSPGSIVDVPAEREKAAIVLVADDFATYARLVAVPLSHVQFPGKGLDRAVHPFSNGLANDMNWLADGGG